MRDHAINPMTPRIGNSVLRSPIMIAAGIWEKKCHHMTNDKKLGALVCKSISTEPREGNPKPHLKELSIGYLNSIGLKNIGLQAFINEKLPLFSRYQCAAIVSIAGSHQEEYVSMIESIEQQENAQNIWGWELNVSCPNVSGGTNIGYDTKRIETLVSQVRKLTTKPLLIKLAPSIENMVQLGKAAEASGADAITAINTVPSMWFDLETRASFFVRGSAGLAGEAILPLALHAVHSLASALSIPIIGVGGINRPEHALQFFTAGACAVQIGSANFKQPLLFQSCYDAAKQFFS